MADLQSYTVKFVDGSPDLRAELAPGSGVDDLAKLIRKACDWPTSQNLRLVCGGKELYAGQTLPSCGAAPVVHCIRTERAANPEHEAELRSAWRSVEQPPVDWIDTLDPGTALMWIFGVTLAFFWLVFLVYGSVFDRASTIMLCTMTAAFLLPYVLSYIPWPASWCFLPDPACADQYLAQEGIPGLRQGCRPDGIPPRPRAQLVGPGS